MAVGGTRRASLLVTAVVILSCPACSLPVKSPQPSDAAPPPPPAPPPVAAQPDCPPGVSLAEIVMTHDETSRPTGHGHADGEAPTLDCWDRLHRDIDLSL